MNYAQLVGLYKSIQLHKTHIPLNKQGRRTVKNKGKHVGFILKHSRVEPQIKRNNL